MLPTRHPGGRHGLAHLPHPLRVRPSRSFSWLAAGWRMFAARPAEWILLALGSFTLLAGATLLVPIPLVGPVLPPLLLALLMGGMLHAAARQAEGHPPRFEDLFSGFRLHASKLTLVGLFYAIPLILMHLLLYLALSGGLLVSMFGDSLGMVVNQLASDVAGMLADLGIALGIFMLMWGMMMLALLLAPSLIMCEGIPSFDAMRLSLSASLRNPGAMFLLAVALYVLFVLALLPAGLGILIYIPVVVGAVAAAHRELFVSPEAPAAPQANDGENP